MKREGNRRTLRREGERRKRERLERRAADRRLLDEAPLQISDEPTGSFTITVGRRSATRYADPKANPRRRAPVTAETEESRA